MKTIATPFVFMCALALFGTTALGQITITSADVSAKLAVGNTLANFLVLGWTFLILLLVMIPGHYPSKHRKSFWVAPLSPQDQKSLHQR